MARKEALTAVKTFMREARNNGLPRTVASHVAQLRRDSARNTLYQLYARDEIRENNRGDIYPIGVGGYDFTVGFHAEYADAAFRAIESMAMGETPHTKRELSAQRSEGTNATIDPEAAAGRLHAIIDAARENLAAHGIASLGGDGEPLGLTLPNDLRFTLRHSSDGGVSVAVDGRKRKIVESARSDVASMELPGVRPSETFVETAFYGDTSGDRSADTLRISLSSILGQIKQGVSHSGLPLNDYFSGKAEDVTKYLTDPSHFAYDEHLLGSFALLPVYDNGKVRIRMGVRQGGPNRSFGVVNMEPLKPGVIRGRRGNNKGVDVFIEDGVVIMIDQSPESVDTRNSNEARKALATQIRKALGTPMDIASSSSVA